MASFAFTARDDVGQTQTGVIDAPSAALVASQLRDRGWIVLNVNQEAGLEASAPSKSLLGRLFRPRSIQIELSLRQLAVMLRGGISLLSAMQTLATQSDNKAIRNAYEELIDQVQQGRPLSDAMEANAFPGFVVRLVGVGERTGILETVLVRGADMMQTRRNTVREIRTALTYPLIVLVAAGGVTQYMVTTLIPKLSELLQGLGRPLPPITQSLVTVSDFVQAWGMTVFATATLLLTAFILTYLTVPGRLFIDRLALRIPIIGKIFRLSGTLTFSQTLSTLVQSGVSVLDSLVTVQQMHGNAYFAQIVQRTRDAIIRGNNLADTLRDKYAFMPLLATMVAVGEESGNLDDVLDQVSEFHRSQLSALIKRLSTWVTPAIVVVVGAIVGYVYIAFFMGIFAAAR